MLKKSVRVFAGLTVLLIALYALFGFAPSISSAQVPAQRGLPPNQPQRGLIYDGLEVATSGACAGLYRVKGTDLCTHGPDPIPQGVQAEEYAPLPAAPEVQSATAVCDGETGYRVQVMYVRAADQADRFAQYRDSMRQWAMRADSIFYESALKTGGTRHIRYVLNSDCSLSVHNVVLSPTGDDNFTNTKDELSALGYNRRDRKYMIFMDASVYCGIGTRRFDDRPDQLNRNNFGAIFGLTGNRCWHIAGSIAAHELMHTLGGVQESAPHSDAPYNNGDGGHCMDIQEVMCSDTTPDYPEVCPTTHIYLFDCNNDDYFHTNPPAGNYLSEYWNTANNQFLIGAATPTPFPPGGRNLALNKPVTADSACDDQRPESAVNGSVSGGVTDRWCSYGRKQWLQVDLGEMATITGFTLRHAGAGGIDMGRNTWEYNVQLSSDGSNWITAASVTNNSDSITSHTIHESRARYARLNVTGASSNGYRVALIYEFEVHGLTDSDPTPTATPTRTVMPTQTTMPTSTPTSTRTATPTAMPTSTPTPMRTATSTTIPTSTPTRTATPTATKMPMP